MHCNPRTTTCRVYGCEHFADVALAVSCPAGEAPGEAWSKAWRKAWKVRAGKTR